MDLGRGNISGNVVPDLGTSGVFKTASGEREFPFAIDKNGKPIVDLPSMEEQAIKNLDPNLKVPGRKKFFAEATLDIVKSMTPEEYEKAMTDEIKRVLPKLKETVKSFDLDKDEKRVYKAMIKRLEEGLNADWKGVHARAVAPVQDLKNKVAVATDEAVQEEIDFFLPRTPIGATWVFDDIWMYDHDKFENFMFDNGFETLERKQIKASYYKTK
jgi:hypothetical protein